MLANRVGYQTYFGILRCIFNDICFVNISLVNHARMDARRGSVSTASQQNDSIFPLLLALNPCQMLHARFVCASLLDDPRIHTCINPGDRAWCVYNSMQSSQRRKFRESLGWKTPFHGGSPFFSLHKRTRHWLFLVICHVITLFWKMAVKRWSGAEMCYVLWAQPHIEDPACSEEVIPELPGAYLFDWLF